MSEHHSHVLTPVSWAKHTQTGIERSVMTFFLSAVISVLQYTTALMWCLIKSQKTFSFIPSTHIFKYLRNNFLGKVKVRLWMFKNLEHFQRQCQTGNKTQTRPEIHFMGCFIFRVVKQKWFKLEMGQKTQWCWAAKGMTREWECQCALVEASCCGERGQEMGDDRPGTGQSDTPLRSSTVWATLYFAATSSSLYLPLS